MGESKPPHGPHGAAGGHAAKGAPGAPAGLRPPGWWPQPRKHLVAYAALSCRRPYRVLAGNFLALLCVLVVNGLVISMDGTLITPTGGREWLVRTSKQVKLQDALEEAQRITAGGKDADTFKEREKSSVRNSDMHLIFRSKSGNMLTPANLAVVRKVEAMFTEDPKFQSYCQLDYSAGGGKGPTCKPPISLTGMLDAAAARAGGADDLNAHLQALSRDPSLSYFFSQDFSGTNLKSEYTRMQVPLGLPLKGYATPGEEEKEQREAIYEGFVKGKHEELVDYTGSKKPFMKSIMQAGAVDPSGDVELVWHNRGLISNEFKTISTADFLWAVFSISAVGIYMSVHCGSVLLGCMGMVEIILSIPLAFFFYRCVFQVQYFSNMHILAIFVLLGIGADDVFVFSDAFKQSAEEAHLGGSLERRIEYATLRASKAVFVTSFTTTIAFLATALSPIMPISTFGIFAALCISLLYLLNVALMPSILYIYGRRKQRKAVPEDADEEDAGGPPPEAAAAGVELEPGHLNVDKLRRLEKFFHRTWAPFVKAARIPIFVVFVGLFITGSFFTAKLQPPTEQEQWFPDDHMFTKYTAKSGPNGPFQRSSSDRVAAVSIAWGVSDMDGSEIGKWDPDNVGKIIWDDGFDIRSPAAQLHVLETCEQAVARPCAVDGCTGGMLVRNAERHCFMETFKAWVEDKNMTFPLPREAFVDELYRFHSNSTASKQHRTDIGFKSDAATGETVLKFARVKFNSTFLIPQPQAKTEEVYDEWEAFTSERNAAAPEGADQGIQTTGYTWMWLVTQVALVESTITGVLICFALAFVVMNFSTGNVVVSLGAIFTISGIVTTVLGVGLVLIMDYPLGISESVATVILIGFSMDYCLHLAVSYVESPRASRYERTQDSLTMMGISVTAGALTTVFSGVFLFGGVITFFPKFAFIIVFTVIVSYLWTVLFFPACMMTFGPNNDFGKWSVILARAKGRDALPSSNRP